MRSCVHNLMCGQWLRSCRRSPALEEGKTMWKKLVFVLIMCVLIMPQLSHGQEAKAVLEGVTKAMGDVKSLQYTGSGASWQLGQSPYPGAP
jgi:hypothetical protein